MTPCPRCDLRRRHRRYGSALRAVALFLPALVAARAEAQRVTAALGVDGGVATDARGVRSSAASVTPSLLFTPGESFSVGLSGSATRFAEAAWALGGTTTAGVRLPLGSRAALGASGLASATTTSFEATYTTLALSPVLEARAGIATLFAGAQVTEGARLLRDTVARPGGILAPGGSQIVSRRESRAGTSALFGALVSVVPARPGRGATLLYREEHARVTDVAVIDRTLTATATAGRLQVSASGGLRRAPDERVSFGNVNAAVTLTSVLAVQAAVGSYPSDRVTAVPGGRFVNVGLRLHGAAGGGDERAAAPHVRGAPPVPAGATRLVLRVPGARRVEIAGDWSSWRLAPASRAAGDVWYADVPLRRGEYRYAFRVDGARWALPQDAATVDDGFGGRSAVLVVP
jgi:hypothetical protein